MVFVVLCAPAWANITDIASAPAPRIPQRTGAMALLSVERWTHDRLVAKAPLSPFAFEPTDHVGATWADWQHQRAIGYQAGLHPERAHVSVSLSLSFTDSWNVRSPREKQRFHLGRYIDGVIADGIDAAPAYVASGLISAFD